MNIGRRTILRGALVSLATATALCAMPAVAQSSWVPTKDVEFVISYAPGGGADIFSRLVVDIIREEKLIPVNITPENRPGGSSAVAIGYVMANKAEDNETLIVLNIASILTPLQNEGAPGWRQLRPLANIMAEDYVVFVKGDSEWNSIEDLAAAAKAGGDGSVNFAVGGIGDTLAAQVVGSSLGTDFNLVTFDGGGESINALLGGSVDATISNPAEFIGQIESGAIKAIGTTKQDPYQGELAAIPTLTQAGFPNPLIQNWRGVAGPAGMSDEAAAYWQAVLAKVSESPRMKEYVENNSASFSIYSGQDYADYIGAQEEVFKGLLQ